MSQSKRKKRTIRKIDIVFIQWEDAAKSDQPWLTAEEIPGFLAEHFWVRSVGFLLENNKTHVVLATDVAYQNDFKPEQWSGVLRVPQPWIKEFKKLGSVTIGDL